MHILHKPDFMHRNEEVVLCITKRTLALELQIFISMLVKPFYLSTNQGHVTNTNVRSVCIAVKLRTFGFFTGTELNP